MKEDYTILGLAPGASQEEIKKAYFRQLRKHSPEKDPEGFKKLRAAYDRLQKQEKKEDAPSFPPFQTKLEQQYADQIEQCRRTSDWALQRDTAQEAWKRFPKDDYFLYQLVIAQIKTGNTGNAVKNALLLTKKDPENKWYQRGLALAYLGRGYYTKAWPELEKVFDMGCRDVKFLLAFASECFKYEGQEDRLLKILKSYLYLEKDWGAEELGQWKQMFDLVEMIHTTKHKDEPFQEEFKLLCRMIESYQSFLKKEPMEWAEILDGAIYITDPGEGIAVAAQNAFSILKALAADADTIREMEKRQDNCLWKLLDSDNRINRAILLMCTSATETGPVIGKFSKTDAMLCMLKEKDEVLEQIPLFREEYPYFYKQIEPWLLQLQQDENTLEQLRDRLLIEHRSTLEKNSISNFYYEWYPEEKEKAYGKIVASGEDTYRRPNKKIGRNDPCPCGSGKKFKQCCMNKGIYD